MGHRSPTGRIARHTDLSRRHPPAVRRSHRRGATARCSWVAPVSRPHATFAMQINGMRISWRLDFLIAMVAAIALTAAMLIAFLGRDYQPADTAAQIETLTP